MILNIVYFQEVILLFHIQHWLLDQILSARSLTWLHLECYGLKYFDNLCKNSLKTIAIKTRSKFKILPRNSSSHCSIAHNNKNDIWYQEKIRQRINPTIFANNPRTSIPVLCSCSSVNLSPWNACPGRVSTMIKVAFINNATAEDVSRKYQGWTHTAYISFIHFPLYFVWFMFTLPAVGTQLPNADCSMHQIVTIIVRRGCCLGLRRPTTDTGWTLKDSNQRPAANLRCEPRHRAPKQTIFIKLFQMSAEHAHCTVRRHLEHHADYIFSCSGINDINTAPHF